MSLKVTSQKPTRGYSLLELTLSFLFTVPILVGALDITLIMQARSVARGAVETGLRCLSTTDSSCSEVRAANARPVYDVTVAASQAIYPMREFGGSVQYVQGTNYAVGPFRAEVLGEAVASFDQFTALGEVESFATEATLETQQLLTEQIDISGASSSWRDPVFVVGSWPDGSEASIAPGGNSRTSDQFNQLGQSSPDWRTAAQSEVFTLTGKFPALNQRDCFDNPDGDCLAGEVPVVLWVKGRAVYTGMNAASADAVCGQVALRVRSLTDGSKQSLGGQATHHIHSRASYPANFFPRGYSSIGHLPNLDMPKVDAIELRHPVKLKRGHRYVIEAAAYINTTIDAGVRCQGGTLSWTMTEADMFGPTLSKQSHTIRCQESAQECGALPTTCTAQGLTIGKNTLSQTQIDANRVGPVVRTNQRVGSTTVSCGGTATSAADVGTLRAQMQGVCACSEVSLRAAGMEKGTMTVSCPVNYGVSDGVKRDGIVYESGEARAACPIVVPANYQNVEVRWTTRTAELAASREFSPQNCSEFEGMKTLAFNRYFPGYKAPDISALQATPLGSTTIQSGKESSGFPQDDANAPAKLVQKPPYNCSAFSAGPQVPVAALRKKQDQENVSTLFDGKQVNCEGSSNPSAWKEVAARELRKYYRDVENAFYVPEQKEAPAEAAACGDTSAIRRATSCEAFYFPGNDSAATKVIHDWTGDSLPQECFSSCSSCVQTLVRFEGDATPEIERNQEAAITLARNQLRAFSPWIMTRCKGGECARVEANLEGSRPRLSATVTVPLISKSLLSGFVPADTLGGNSIDVNYSAEREYERKYAVKQTVAMNR